MTARLKLQLESVSMRLLMPALKSISLKPMLSSARSLRLMKLKDMLMLNAINFFSRNRHKKRDIVNSKLSKLDSFKLNNLLSRKKLKKKQLVREKTIVRDKLMKPLSKLLLDINSTCYNNVKLNNKDSSKLRDKSRSVNRLKLLDVRSKKDWLLKSKQVNSVSVMKLNVKDRLVSLLLPLLKRRDSKMKRPSVKEKCLSNRE